MKSSMPPTRQPWSLALFFLNSLLNILIFRVISKCKNTSIRRNKRKFGAEKAFKTLELRWFRCFVSSFGEGRQTRRGASGHSTVCLPMPMTHLSKHPEYQTSNSRQTLCVVASTRPRDCGTDMLSFGDRRHKCYLWRRREEERPQKGFSFWVSMGYGHKDSFYWAYFRKNRP